MKGRIRVGRDGKEGPTDRGEKHPGGCFETRILKVPVLIRKLMTRQFRNTPYF